MSNEDNREKMLSEEELANVAGGTRQEVYEIINFYKSKGVKFPANIREAAGKACNLLYNDLNISVALNIQDNSSDSKNSYHDRHKQYSHVEIMDMLGKKYGK